MKKTVKQVLRELRDTYNGLAQEQKPSWLQTGVPFKFHSTDQRIITRQAQTFDNDKI